MKRVERDSVRDQLAEHSRELFLGGAWAYFEEHRGGEKPSKELQLKMLPIMKEAAVRATREVVEKLVEVGVNAAMLEMFHERMHRAGFDACRSYFEGMN